MKYKETLTQIITRTTAIANRSFSFAITAFGNISEDEWLETIAAIIALTLALFCFYLLVFRIFI